MNHFPARLASLTSLALVAAGTAAAEPPPLPAIPKAHKAINVDGRLDDADWSRGLVVPVDFVWGKGTTRAATPPLVARFLWDDFYLYIGYETVDANLTARAMGGPQGPEDAPRRGCDLANDCDLVEFFVVLDDQNFFWETHHNAANDFGDVLCLVSLPGWKKSRPALAGADIYFAMQEFIQDQGPVKLARAVAPKPRKQGGPSTVNDASDTDTGYTGEIRLPWFGIGAPAAVQKAVETEPSQDGKPAAKLPGWNMQGREISILSVSQNGDSADRYCTSAAGLEKGKFFHLQAAAYPRYRLAD